MQTTVNDCKIVSLRTIARKDWGELTIIEGHKDIPFGIKRIYYLHNIPKACERGYHAHKRLSQLMIAISGSLKVRLLDGCRERLVNLDNPNEGLLILAGIWRELVDFSKDAVCLILASERYDEKDYIRDYDDFLKFKKC
jgi:hypothetical protein